MGDELTVVDDVVVIVTSKDGADINWLITTQPEKTGLSKSLTRHFGLLPMGDGLDERFVFLFWWVIGLSIDAASFWSPP